MGKSHAQLEALKPDRVDLDQVRATGGECHPASGLVDGHKHRRTNGLRQRSPN